MAWKNLEKLEKPKNWKTWRAFSALAGGAGPWNGLDGGFAAFMDAVLDEPMKKWTR